MKEKWEVIIEYQDLKTYKYHRKERTHDSFNLALRDLRTFTKKNIDIVKYTINKIHTLL